MDTTPLCEFTLSEDTDIRTAVLVDNDRTIIDCFHRDLISFMSIATVHKVDFLPLTWDDSCAGLGKGATGDVKQSTVNLQTSFAFKLFKSNDKDSMFRELISEVVLLSQKSIRIHPNIIDLEGIIFHIDHDTEELWPALVFKKAPFGSLDKFMGSDAGTSISIPKRLKLCSEIGAAIMTMHAADVIHGDIKPENVIVFGDNSGGFIAKVIDFGYSCIGAKDKDLVYLPRTLAWCAPEYHDRGFLLPMAKKTDIYSFAMVCLWVLFNEGFNRLRMELERTKDREQFRRGAMDLASTAEYPGSKLRTFFDLALRNNCEERESDLGKLVSLLGQEIWQPSIGQSQRPLTINDYGASADDIKDPEKFRSLLHKIFSSLHLTGSEYRIMQNHLDPARFKDCEKTEAYINLILEGLTMRFAIDSYEQESDTRFALTHGCFNISEVMFQLSYVDYRARVYIAQCLERKAKDSRCKPCSNQAAFQLAMCYSTGFGVVSDPQEAKYWLEKSSLDDSELAQQLDRLRHLKPNDLRPGTFPKLASRGHLTLRPTDRYRSHEQLSKAQLYHEREIKDMERCLGQYHPFILEMRHILQWILAALGKENEAEKIGWELKHSSEKILGPNHPLTLRIIVDLAERCRRQQKWEQAEMMAFEAKEMMEKVLEPEHPFIILAREILARVYGDIGKVSEADKLLVQVAQAEESIYGLDHIRLLQQMGNDGWRHMIEGNLGLAEDLLFQATNRLEKLLGASDAMTMRSTRNLALTYRKQGRFMEAEKMLEELKKRTEKALDPGDPEILNVTFDLARTYQFQGKLAEAEGMLVNVYEGRKTIFGPNNAQTIYAISSLAELYTKQGRHSESEVVLNQIKVAKENELGPYHQDTLIATRGLGVCYIQQGKFEEAEKLMWELRERWEITIGPAHEETLGCMSNIGYIYLCQGRYMEAKVLLSEAKQKLEEYLGPEHPYTKATTRSLLSVILKGNLAAQEINKSDFLDDEEDDKEDDEENSLRAAIAMSLELNPGTSGVEHSGKDANMEQLRSADPHSDDDDEILRQAIELSLQNHIS